MQIHIARDGQRMGPFPLEEVNRQLAAGSLQLSDLAWYEGIPNWVSLSQVPGIGAPGVMAGPGISATPQSPAGVAFAGFWIRLVAYIIDCIILGIPLGILNIALRPSSNDPQSGHPALIFCITLIVEIAYFGGLWSSSVQATLGQKVCGLRVVSASDFSRISFVRGAGRFFGMILSGLILFIGFIMIAFTERKQGLHDMLAGTYVIRG
jgi:uncharacterized RDD family membrane protein YckC